MHYFASSANLEFEMSNLVGMASALDSWKLFRIKYRIFCASDVIFLGRQQL
jgi:hypothetical protein